MCRRKKCSNTRFNFGLAIHIYSSSSTHRYKHKTCFASIGLSHIGMTFLHSQRFSKHWIVVKTSVRVNHHHEQLCRFIKSISCTKGAVKREYSGVHVLIKQIYIDYQHRPHRFQDQKYHTSQTQRVIWQVCPNTPSTGRQIYIKTGPVRNFPMTLLDALTYSFPSSTITGSVSKCPL